MNRRTLWFHPQAKDEALAAHDWYAEHSGQAGEAFQQALEESCRAIADAPDMWAAYLSRTKRYFMKRFPFVVVHRVADEAIEIVAVAHGHRRPGYWKDRVPDGDAPPNSR